MLRATRLGPRRRGSGALALAAAVAGLAVASSARSQSLDRLDQSVWGHVGLLRTSIESLVRLDLTGTTDGRPTVAGTTLGFERDLGLNRGRTVPKLLLGWRVAPRWRVEFETYALQRSARQIVLEQEIVIDGTTYEAAGRLDSTFDSRVVRLSGGYSFYRSDTTEAGVMLGVQDTRYSLRFTGQGRVADQMLGERSVVQEDSGPLPTVGLYVSTALAPGWSGSARADYLTVDSSRTRGHLVNLEANIYHRITPHLSAGLGYKAVEYQVGRRSAGELTGRFEYRFRGPQLLLEAGF